MYDRSAAVAAADFLRTRCSRQPTVAVMAGTGLGDMAGALEADAVVAYGDIPNFPVSTVQSHAGRWVFGRWAGQPVVLLQGRLHLYEGYSPRAVTFPIRVLQALGVKTLVLTNASGGLNPAFGCGDMMVLTDHINLAGANPLIGPNEESWGPRFPDMTAAYNSGLRELARTEARALGIEMPTGVYAGLKGPSLETPAEMRFLRTIGADAVGFSTVMETIAAVHGGMRVLAFATITNMCMPDNAQPANVDAIIAVAQSAAPRLATLIGRVLERLDEE
ncbi:MAG: purine-nucleoside phosphorylase [Desulfatitalea sp.]|nr:purine-nucleoside phosphorylase [Desulfatitalea sp.]MBI5896223.1 purine-nucleoside phosphorylase [Desulfobacterales bacterium]